MLNDTFRTILTLSAEKTNEPQEIVAFVDAERNNNTNNFIETVLNYYFQTNAPKPLPTILAKTLIELEDVLQKPYEAFIAAYPHKEALEKALQSSRKNRRDSDSDSDEPSTSFFDKQLPPAPKKPRTIIRKQN